MATPYLQLRLDTVPSTQDVAREALDDLPVLVLAAGQTEGRGRSGSRWISAPRALAASLAVHIGRDDQRPFSLMAGVGASRAIESIDLKWPNDLLMRDSKVGGILVERSGGEVTIGLGVNLWWPEAPDGMGALLPEDPGPNEYLKLGALWGAEVMAIIDMAGWPADEYRARCSTIGTEITWAPGGAGLATGVDAAGGLIVEADGGEHVLRSGEIRHIRSR